MPRIRATSREAILALMRDAGEIMTHLRSMNYSIDDSADVFVCAITRCFTVDMRSAWDDWCTDKKPTLSELRAFLKEYAERIHEMQVQPSGSRPDLNRASTSSATATMAKEQAQSGQREGIKEPQPSTSRARSPSRGRQRPPKICPACPNAHYLQYCPIFGAMSLAERQAKVKGWTTYLSELFPK